MPVRARAGTIAVIIIFNFIVDIAAAEINPAVNSPAEKGFDLVDYIFTSIFTGGRNEQRCVCSCFLSNAHAGCPFSCAPTLISDHVGVIGRNPGPSTTRPLITPSERAPTRSSSLSVTLPFGVAQ